jgi:hypothetical protein
MTFRARPGAFLAARLTLLTALFARDFIADEARLADFFIDFIADDAFRPPDFFALRFPLFFGLFFAVFLALFFVELERFARLADFFAIFLAMSRLLAWEKLGYGYVIKMVRAGNAVVLPEVPNRREITARFATTSHRTARPALPAPVAVPA